MKLQYTVKKEDAYQNVNDVLSKQFHISTRLKTKLINHEMVSLNDKVCDTRMPIKEDDIILVDFNMIEDNTNI